MPALNLTQRVALGTLLQAAGKAVALLLALGATKLATTYLGVDAYGDFALVLVVATLVLVVGDLGLSTLVARELGRRPDEAEEILATALTFRLLTCGVVAVVAAIVVPFLPYPGTVRVGMGIGIAGAIVGVLSVFPVPVFQARLRLGLVALAEIAGRAATLAAMAVVVALDGGFLALVACAALGWGASLAVAFRLLRPYWRAGLGRSRVEIRRMLTAALPIGVIAVLSLLHFKLDAVLLSLMRPSRDVGTYAVAYAVIEQALVLPGLLMAGVFPILSRMVASSDRSAPVVVDRTFRFLTLGGIAIAGVVATLASPLVHLVSGDGYEEAIPILRILAAALVPLFATVVLSALLIAAGSLRAVMTASSIGIVLNVALNLLLIPDHAGQGAAAATIVCECVGLVVVWEAARRTLGRAPVSLASLARLVVVAAVTAGVLRLAWSLPLVAVLGVGAVAFGVAVIATRAVTGDDLHLLVRRAGGAGEGQEPAVAKPSGGT